MVSDSGIDPSSNEFILCAPSYRYPSDGGWYYHVISTISEWIMATIFSIFILSFSPEFRDISLDHPQISLFSYTMTV